MKYLQENQEKCLAELDFDQKQMFWIGWAQSLWCSVDTWQTYKDDQDYEYEVMFSCNCGRNLSFI